QSLVLLDEIGRGTATFDGLSIAWAVAEHLASDIGARTIFATHYHELTGLHETLDGVQNFNIAVKEYNDDIVFLRKLVAGPANRSYGIQVGRLAGLPQMVVDRAKVILRNLELTDHDQAGRPVLARQDDGTTRTRRTPQLSLLEAQQVAAAAASAPAHLNGSPAGPALTEIEAGVLDALKGFDISTNTPIEALNLIYSLKQRLEE
ncbi:MAG: DNA mismatch repair protein MutS, partial [Myxococcota bacterium]